MAILFVFGCLQFLSVAVLTLFGIYFDWKQYLASVILAAVGLFSIRILLKMLPDTNEK